MLGYMGNFPSDSATPGCRTGRPFFSPLFFQTSGWDGVFCGWRNLGKHLRKRGGGAHENCESISSWKVSRKRKRRAYWWCNVREGKYYYDEINNYLNSTKPVCIPMLLLLTTTKVVLYRGTYCGRSCGGNVVEGGPMNP